MIGSSTLRLSVLTARTPQTSLAEMRVCWCSGKDGIVHYVILKRFEIWEVSILVFFKSLKRLFASENVSKDEYLAEVAARKRIAAEFTAYKREQESRIKARTERLHLENLRLKARIDLSEQAQSNDTSLIALLSHDIRTPLNGIVGMLELMRMDEVSEEHAELIALATRSSDKLTGVVSKILDYSKLEAQRMKLDVGQFALRPAVEEVIETFASDLDDRRLSVKLCTRGDMVETVRGDGRRFKQILNNILERSIGVSRNGVIEIELACHRIGNSFLDVEVQIHDTGADIVDPELQERYLKGSGVDIESGKALTNSGLGLAISKRLVELMHGNIAMATEPGIGTTYRYTARFHNTPSPGVFQAEGKRDLAYLKNMKILLVEDDETSQLHLKRLLANAGHVVEIAESGVLAVAAAEQREFDLILMDIVLPEMDGVVAAKRIRSDGGLSAAVPIVALTANVGNRERDDYLANGIDEYVTKPIKSETLFSAIGKVTRTHGQSGTA